MKQNLKNVYTKGFTLIELLVVIAVIIILASIMISSISLSRAKARDTQRISDIRQMRLALELYKSDHGDYPVTTNDYFIDNSYDNWSGSWSGNPVTLKTDLAPYLSKLPIDPVNSSPQPWIEGNGYGYAYKYKPGSHNYDTTQRYDLVTILENKASPLRCEIKGWLTGWNGKRWCGGAPGNDYEDYSKYIYTGEY